MKELNTYGIHTFEITITQLYGQDFHILKNKLKPISEYIKSEKYYLVRTKRDSGMRIRLYTNPHHPPYLKVIVNPWKLMNKVQKPMDNTNILLPGFDTAALHDSLCEQLRFYLGDEFGIDRFMLTRIDCTTDFCFDAPIYCGAYINLVRNSIWRRAEKEEKRYDDDDPETCRYYFKLSQHKYYSFTVYDKIYDLIRLNKLADKPYDYGLLRFELSFESRKINDVKKELGTDNIISLINYYTDHSEEFIKKFIKQRFVLGNYYSFPDLCEYLNNNCRRKMQNKIITLLTDSKDMDRRELKDKMCRIFKTESKIRTIKQALKELEINPVLIPCRYNIKTLPGLYEIFGISRE